MPFCDWDNDDWHTLTFAIQQKNCILMLGPDIPIDDNAPMAMGQPAEVNVTRLVTAMHRDYIKHRSL